MNFKTEIQQLTADLVAHYEKRGKTSDARCFKYGLAYFQTFVVTYRSHIRCISEITRKDIDLYISYLWSVEYGGHLQSRYLNRDNFVYRSLRALNKLFDYLIIHEDTIDIRHLPKQDLIQKKDFPTPHRRGVKHFPAWFDKYVLSCINGMKEDSDKRLVLKAMMMCLYYLGARGSDVCTLETNCCVTKYGFTWINIFSNKTRRYYDIPIPSELKDILLTVQATCKQYLAQHPTLDTKCMFMFMDPSDLEQSRFNLYQRVKRLMRTVYEKAEKDGLPVSSLAELSLTTHKFRHTVAIRLIRLGADPMLVAEFLGHGDLSMAQSYIQESEAEIDATLTELWEDDSLGLEKHELDNIEVSREDILRFKGPVSKTECGWCTHLNGKAPCGADPYGCWLCEDLKPDLEDPEYVDRMMTHLVDHQTLLERNRRMGYFGEAKIEEKIIARINGFIAQAQAIGEC